MSSSRPITPALYDVGPDGPRLLAGRCVDCARLHFPATDTCPYCGVAGAAVVAVGERGTLWLWTVVASRPPGYRGPLPYGFGVVELDDVELRVVTRLTETHLDRLHEGLRMRLVVEPLFSDDDGVEVTSYAYRPEDA